jgi:hypothetical protein
VVVGIRRLKFAVSTNSPSQQIRRLNKFAVSKTNAPCGAEQDRREREGVDEDTEAEFEKLNTRIEALVGGIAALADVVQLTHSMVCNLAEWLKEPPSTDLPKLLRQIVAKLDALPSEVARAVSPGELHRR